MCVYKTVLLQCSSTDVPSPLFSLILSLLTYSEIRM